MDAKLAEYLISMPDTQTQVAPGATSDKRVVATLRQMIMDGSLSSGSRISEVRVSEMFDVSRTPARLALGALEAEGLIKKREGRGFTVEKFNFDDLSKAYEVRGVLEGLAAGTLARLGPSEALLASLHGCLKDIDRILAQDSEVSQKASDYQDANIAFHNMIMKDCGNEFVGYTFARLENLPLVNLGTLVFNETKAEEELMRLRLGNLQHRLIVDAIERRDSFRAESLMREHANQIPVYTGLLV